MKLVTYGHGLTSQQAVHTGQISPWLVSRPLSAAIIFDFKESLG